MSLVTIDASTVTNWGNAMAQAPDAMRTELIDTTNALLVTGSGLAQSNAPMKEGVLRASIGIIEPAGVGGGSITGAYGTSLIYAKQREFGGIIRARNAPFLVFFWKGGWVKTKQVSQKGSRYMGRSAESMRGRIRPAYEAAIARVMAGLGG